jgi:hypothetical protein
VKIGEIVRLGEARQNEMDEKQAYSIEDAKKKHLREEMCIAPRRKFLRHKRPRITVTIKISTR